MTPAEVETVRRELAAAAARANAAERRAIRAERERDHARALLARLRTTLSERTDEPIPLRPAA